MNQPRQGGDARDVIVKIAFGAGALVCVLTGLVLYLFAEQLGIDRDTAELIAIAFLIAGFVDYLVLRFWDRLMAGRQR